MSKNSQALLVGFLASILTGAIFGWPLLVVGLILGLATKVVSGWKGIGLFALGVVLGIVFIAFLPVLLPR